MSINNTPYRMIDEIIKSVSFNFKFNELDNQGELDFKKVASMWTGDRLAVVSIGDENILISVNPSISSKYHLKTVEYSVMNKVKYLYTNENMRGLYEVLLVD